MAVFRKAVLVRWAPPGEVNVVCLGNVGLQSPRGAIHLLAVIGSAGAINIEAGENFRDGLIDAKNNLDMTRGILAANSESMLGSHSGGLGKKRVPDPGFNVFDLLDSLLFGEAVHEQIDIRGRAELFVKELAEASLGAVMVIRNRKKTVDNRGAGSDNVVPVQLNKGRLGEDIEVALKVLERLNNGGRLVRAA